MRNFIQHHRRPRGILPALSCWLLLASSLAPLGSAQEPPAADGEVPSLAPYVMFDVGGHVAPVRALAFSHNPKEVRLLSAGQDKMVRSWSIADVRLGDALLALEVMPERPIYWEASHGPAGVIYALACDPRRDVVALAGASARGWVGDVAWADLVGGDFVGFERPEEDGGHRHTVESLAYSAGGDWLASIDKYGRVLVRKLPGKPAQIAGDDGQPLPGKSVVRSIAVAGDRLVVWPRWHAGERRWRLATYDLATGRGGEIPKPRNTGMVTALSASDDGRLVAWSDTATGKVYLNDLGDERFPAAAEFDFAPWGKMVRSLALSHHNGAYVLAIGTVDTTNNTSGAIYVAQLGEDLTAHWRIARKTPTAVYACAVSPDQRYVAYSGLGRHGVAVQSLEALPKELADPGIVADLYGGMGLRGVAFALDARFPSGTIVVEGDDGVRRLFDPSKPGVTPIRMLDGKSEPDVAAESSSILALGPWSARLVDKSVMLFKGSRPMARFPGAVCHCFIPNAAGEPVAVAVGEDDTDSGVKIYQLQDVELANRQVDPIELNPARVFKGHSGAVTQLTLSPEGDFLASCSSDGTARYWNLGTMTHERLVPRRWGVELGNTGEALRVQWIEPESPLYHSGVKVGDELYRIYVGADQTPVEAPVEMYGRLQGAYWSQPVTFHFRREGKPRPVFAADQGWQSTLAVLFAEESWVAWAHNGAYHSSADGEPLLRWLVFRRYTESPTVHEVRDMREAYHHPEVIQGLFLRDDLPDPVAAVVEPVAEPTPLERLADVPKITITVDIVPAISQADGAFVSPVQDVEIHCTATADRGDVNSLELLVNGSVREGTLRGFVGPGKLRRDVCPYALEPGKRTEFQVRARVEGFEQSSEPITVVYDPDAPQIRALHLLSIGIGEAYPQAKLASAAKDAQRVQLAMQDLHAYDRLYEHVLLEDDARRARISDEFKNMAAEMKDGDVALVYFSGHGFNAKNEAGEEDFYLAPSDFDLADIPGTCIGAKEFFAQVAGRGTVIFIADACHAGTALKGDVVDQLGFDLSHPKYGVVFMGACKADQQAYENNDVFGGGVFSHVLTRALGSVKPPTVADQLADDFIKHKEADKKIYAIQLANENSDGYVDTGELRDELQAKVGELARKYGHPQDPIFNTRGYRSIPLTKVAQAGDQR